MSRPAGAGAGAVPVAAGEIVRLANVVKEYRLGSQVLRAVDEVSLAIAERSFVAVVGRSGSGKSTLLHLIAGIDVPDQGEIEVDGRRLSGLDDDALTRFRRDRIGMIYQFFNLLPTLSVRENVALPAMLAGVPDREALARADARLAEVELEARAGARPHTLSGGEMQRAAIARALVTAPPLVLADEPTGNLDSSAAALVLATLRRLADLHGATVLLVTHSPEAAAAADRVVELRDGRVVRDATV